jgi:hypothetical protein
LGFTLAIVYLVVITHGALHGVCGEYQLEITLDKMMSNASMVPPPTSPDCGLGLPDFGLINVSLGTVLPSLQCCRYIRVCVWIGAIVFGLFTFLLALPLS